MGVLLSALVGLVTGFVVCIPPGPINVAILREATRGRVRAALLCAAGGAAADTAISLAVRAGVHWLLESVLGNVWVRFCFSVLLIGLGLGIITADRRRRRAPEEAPQGQGTVHGPLLGGFLSGIANPGLVGNWALIVALLVSHRLLAGGVAESAAFAFGVGAGGFLWYALLVWLLHALRDHPVGRWLRESVVLAGVLLVLFGLYFTAKTWMAVP